MKDVWDSFADVIENGIRDRKLRWWISLPSAVSGLLAASGVLSGINIFANLTLILFALVLGLSVLALALSRRYMRQRIGKQQQILNRYADQILTRQQNDPSYFAIKKWDETSSVGKHGDTVIVRRFTLVIGPQAVPTIWTLASRHSDAHLDPAIMKKVGIEVRFVNEDGSLGPQVVSVPRWEGRVLRVFIHFDRDLVPKEEVHLQLRLSWPRYYADVLDGQTEPNHWTFRRDSVEFESTTIFEKTFAPKGLRVSPLRGSPVPTMSKNETNGSTSIRFALSQITVGAEYGYRVDLIR